MFTETCILRGNITIFLSGLDIVNGARANDNQETVISTLDDVLSSLSTFNNGLCSLQSKRDIFHQDLRRDKRLDTLDALVIKLVQSCPPYRILVNLTIYHPLFILPSVITVRL